MKTVEMPKMGDTMEEGKILRWIKHEGDEVKKNDILAEIETDKVNIEIESFASGILRKILIAEGDSAPIGAPIAYIGAADEPVPGEAAATGVGPVATANGKAAKNGKNGKKAAVEAVATTGAGSTTMGAGSTTMGAGSTTMGAG